MKKYYVEIDGMKIEITKAVNNVLKEHSGEPRREKYVMKTLVPKHEISLDNLIEQSFPIEQHMVNNPITLEQIIYPDTLSLNLRKAINHLTPEEKTIIKAIYYNGLTERELEAITDCPRSTIGYKKRRIIKKLKKLIEIYEKC